MKGVSILMVFLAVVQLAVEPSQAVDCDFVDAALQTCVNYLTHGGNPSIQCCAGVIGIKGQSQTPNDKNVACKCLKAAANRYPDLKDDAAKSLPDKCGVQLDIPISRTTNCDAISERGVSCGQVDAALTPCVPFLTQGGKPTEQCCAGVRNIKQMASNVADKRAACNCVKSAANRYANLKDDAAKSLPTSCGVKLDIPISRTTNCEAISERGVSCGQVDAALTPCVPFLTQGGKPTEQCCAGVRNIKQMASNVADKREVCNCVKSAANRYASLKDDAAKSLPTSCGVALDIPISRTTNCEAISQGGVSCGQVDAALTPCVSFLTHGGKPTEQCCAGVRNIQQMASNVEDKRAACNCVKSATNRYANLRDDAAKSLPISCGVALDIPISRTTNCEAISQGGVSCGQVDAALTPCVPFLTQGGKPTEHCCAGVRNINQMASNVADKRAACNCVKSAANRYANLKDDAAKALPTQCGVQMDIPVSRTTNCDAIRV